MTRCEIITELYKSKEIDSAIDKNLFHSKTQAARNREDFKQELFLIISQIKEEILVQLHQSRQLRFYVVRIILNMNWQKNNEYNRVYLNKKILYNTDELYTLNISAEAECLEERIESEEKELELVRRIDNLDQSLNSPAYRCLVLAVDKFGSQREVSKKTGIPASVISRSIKKVREHLTNV